MASDYCSVRQYWLKVLNHSNNRLSKQVYQIQKHDIDNNDMRANWARVVRDIVNSIQIIAKASIACLVYKGNTYTTYGGTAIQCHLLYII